MRRRIHINNPGEHAQHGDPYPNPDAATHAEGGQADGADGGLEAGGQTAEVEALQAKVAELESQVEAERNQYLRTLADFQNFRRRNEEQRGELAQFANREIILGMLPVLDNFERALAAADKNQSYE